MQILLRVWENKGQEIKNTWKCEGSSRCACIPSTCFAVSLFFGSGSSICLTKLLAHSEMFGHGSLLKSITPRRMACATPCSDSTKIVMQELQHYKMVK